jgi:predicted ribosome quality control (RQC) complex YloA/Tae2 family protein
MRELASLDIYYLVKEFQELVGSRVETIYHPGDLLFKLHSQKFGKVILRISKNCIFFSGFKEDQPQNPTSFCMVLRKHLLNAKLSAISQEGSERIVKLVFEKEVKYFVYAELFGKGDIVLADSNSLIIASFFSEKGAVYSPKMRKCSFFVMKESEFKNLVKGANESIVKVLATVVGLGGVYSELLLEGMDKAVNAQEISLKDIDLLYRRMHGLLGRKIEPSFFNGRIMPFLCGERAGFASFNDAVACSAVKALEEGENNRILKPFLLKKAKIEKIIFDQAGAIKRLENEVLDNTKKGEAVYNNYELVKDILEQLKKAKEKMSWKEIKEKLKGHKIVKEVNEKEGKLVIEL